VAKWLTFGLDRPSLGVINLATTNAEILRRIPTVKTARLLNIFACSVTAWSTVNLQRSKYSNNVQITYVLKNTLGQCHGLNACHWSQRLIFVNIMIGLELCLSNINMLCLFITHFRFFSMRTLYPFKAGINSLRATLPAEILYWWFQSLKGLLHGVFISRSALKG
jgi:hypothetical protein